MRLSTLKTKLQEVLNESDSYWDYNQDWLSAIKDGMYSCDLSVIALEQWLTIWTATDSHCLTGAEQYYQEGVQFVADTWDELKSSN